MELRSQNSFMSCKIKMLKRAEKSEKRGSIVATTAGERAQKPVCRESKRARVEIELNIQLQFV